MSNAMFDVIQEDLEALEEFLIEGVESSSSLVTEMGHHLINAGGKRIRPALCFLAAHGGKDFSREHVLPLAAAFELLHTASLVHDDVIDEANTRRGAPTANAKWNNQVAILGGDFLFARAFRYVADADYGSYVFRRLADLVGDLSVGEIDQDQELYKVSKDEEHYYVRIAKKTANFLEIACELGAVVGNLPKEQVKALAGYGYAIGMAFQITDDLLDIQQTSEQIGKPAGNDIKQGIVTLPILRALAVTEHREELERIVTNPKMTDEELQRALAIVRETDAEDYAREKVEAYLTEAKVLIPKELPEDIRQTYSDVADFIGARDF